MTTNGRPPRPGPRALVAALALVGAAGLVTTGSASAAVTDAAPPCTAGVPPAPLADRAAVAPAHGGAVDCLAFYGVTAGVPTGDTVAFLPERSLSRGAMASLLARGLRAAGHQLPAPGGAFTDVEGGAHADAVRRLAAAGVVRGVTPDRYAPAAEISRAQVASLLLRAVAFTRDVPVESLEVSGAQRFTDVSGVHAPAISGAARLGLVHGVTPTTYAPARSLSRAQMASLVARLMDSEAVTTTTCTSEEHGYSVAHPASWRVNDGSVVPACSVFDPVSVVVPEGTELPTTLAVSFSDEDVAFDQVVAGTVDDVVARADFAVDGRRAVRQDLVATGEGLYDRGFRYTRVVVDRGSSTLIGTTFDAGDLAYEQKRDVLTRMALSLDLSATGLPPFLPASAVTSAPGEGVDLDLADVRVAHHDAPGAGYDRVVLEFTGDGTVGWTVAEWRHHPTHSGSGRPVDVDGDVALALAISQQAVPPQPPFAGETSLDGPRLPVREVVTGTVFEAVLDAYLGADAPAPYRVFRLSDPERLVVDVQSDAG